MTEELTEEDVAAITTPTDDLCPVGCGRKVQWGKVTCAPCWREVPKDLQRAVYAAWRKVSRDLTPENLRAHREAKEAAIGSIR